MQFELLFENAFGESYTIKETKKASGGDINKAFIVDTDKGKFFVKYNHADKYPQMLEKEANGLMVLKKVAKVNVPEVLAQGEFNAQRYLILECIERGYRSKTYWQDFATQLAGLHQCTSDKFGLFEDNYIGSLPQVNIPETDWLKFFIEHRLLVQAKIALDKGLVDQWFVRKLEVLAIKLPKYVGVVKPSLLHGDLWHGNYMIDLQGNPIVYDPAVYYGNSEMEIAFTELFGRMDDQFYYSYFEQNPSDEGYEIRADIYNIYPLLVHVNLFGQSYLSGIEQVLSRLT